MAAKKASSAMEFIIAQLKKNKTASYAEIKQAAEARGLEIYPINYGRAQTILGIVKAKPRGQGKAAVQKKKAAAASSAASAGFGVGAPVVRRGPGRPRKNPVSVDTSSLDGIIAAVKNSENEKARYRNALERIHTILASTMS